MKRYQTGMILLAMLLLLSLLAAGCTGTAGAKQEDKPTDFMAWQFAQGLIKPRLPRPNNATFPRYKSSFVEQNENNNYLISSHVNTMDANGNIISFSFTVEARYVGNDVFEEVSVELRKN